MEFLKDLIVNIGTWLEGLLASAGLPEVWVHVIMLATGAFALAFVPLVAVIFLIWFERKIVARVGSWLSPDNLGAYGRPWSLRQLLADAIKPFTKEDVTPAGANRRVFSLAPVLALIIAVLTWAVIPLGKGVIGSDLNIGVFYVLSLGSMSMIAILMAGWGSNSEGAMSAALHGIATLISTGVPQALSVLAVVMLAGSLSMQDIIEAQEVPFLFALPLTALLFLAPVLSEPGRRPLGPVEAGSETVAGHLIEYSGVKLGMFYLAELVNQLASITIFATLFLGGWRGPWVDQIPILGTLWLVLKVLLCILMIQLLRHAFPRLWIDRYLGVSRKFLTPLALVNVCVVALAGKAAPASADPWGRAGALLGANVLMALAVLGVLALAGRRARQSAVSG
jgi:NADH-quinone oxidoreductase subunit H